MPLNLTPADLFMLVGLPAISNFAGSMVASNAAGRAADTQVAATERAAELNRESSREAIDLQRQIYNDQIQRAEPYRQGGLGAFSQLLSWSGLPSSAAPPQSTGIPATGGGGRAINWSPPRSETRGGNSWLPAAVNTVGTLGGLAMLGGGGGVGAGGAIGTLNPATGALVTGGGGTLGTLGTLVHLAKNPITIVPAAAILGAMGWLKSQAHWEANDAVQNFENPFHYEFLAPLSQALDNGQIAPDEAVQLLDKNWNLYQQSIRQWAGSSSDRKKVAQQSITNPKFVGTIEGIRQKAVGLQAQGTSQQQTQQVTPTGGNISNNGQAASLLAIADRYRRRA